MKLYFIIGHETSTSDESRSLYTCVSGKDFAMGGEMIRGHVSDEEVAAYIKQKYHAWQLREVGYKTKSGALSGKRSHERFSSSFWVRPFHEVEYHIASIEI